MDYSTNSEVSSSGVAVLDYVDRLLSENDESSSYKNAQIMDKVDSLLDEDYQCAVQAPLVLENRDNKKVLEQRNDFEWMKEDGTNNKIAMQSVDPIFDAQEIASIRSAAEELWFAANKDDDDDASSSTTTSRFTYQYPGNSEAHVSDFQSPVALECINRALQERIYPMIRQHFWDPSTSTSDDNTHPTTTTLYVYDALMIRYNATASPTSQAGQPLHRDFGIVSVNVMLNHHLIDFEGGGTAFENSFASGPKKPTRGAGHCLAHLSSERHAGAATHQGVRDILVIFVAGTNSPELQTARLKQICREACCKDANPFLCQIRHYRLALEASALKDGESFLYLGTSLMEYAAYLNTNKDFEDNASRPLTAAIDCFREAEKRIPCDARVYNNLGIALGRWKQQPQIPKNYDSSNVDKAIEEAYSRGLELLIQSSLIGCNVEQDLDSLSLNYGLYLANQDEYAKSCDVLARFLDRDEHNSSSSSKLVQDAVGLWKFCNRQMQTAT